MANKRQTNKARREASINAKYVKNVSADVLKAVEEINKERNRYIDEDRKKNILDMIEDDTDSIREMPSYQRAISKKLIASTILEQAKEVVKPKGNILKNIISAATLFTVTPIKISKMIKDFNTASKSELQAMYSELLKNEITYNKTLAYGKTLGDSTIIAAAMAMLNMIKNKKTALEIQLDVNKIKELTDEASKSSFARDDKTTGVGTKQRKKSRTEELTEERVKTRDLMSKLGVLGGGGGVKMSTDAITLAAFGADVAYHIAKIEQGKGALTSEGKPENKEENFTEGITKMSKSKEEDKRREDLYKANRKNDTNSRIKFANSEAEVGWSKIIADLKTNLENAARDYYVKYSKYVIVTSTFRDKEKQDDMHNAWNDYTKDKNNKEAADKVKKYNIVAKPGKQSAHSTGQAVDIDGDQADRMEADGILKNNKLKRPVKGDRVHITLASYNGVVADSNAPKTNLVPPEDKEDKSMDNYTIEKPEGPEIDLNKDTNDLDLYHPDKKPSLSGNTRGENESMEDFSNRVMSQKTSEDTKTAPTESKTEFVQDSYYKNLQKSNTLGTKSSKSSLMRGSKKESSKGSENEKSTVGSSQGTPDKDGWIIENGLKYKVVDDNGVKTTMYEDENGELLLTPPARSSKFENKVVNNPSTPGTEVAKEPAAGGVTATTSGNKGFSEERKKEMLKEVNDERSLRGQAPLTKLIVPDQNKVEPTFNESAETIGVEPDSAMTEVPKEESGSTAESRGNQSQSEDNKKSDESLSVAEYKSSYSKKLLTS